MDAKIAEMSQDLEDGVEPTGFLSTVIASHQLSPGEIYATVSELMAAAVDTVIKYIVSVFELQKANTYCLVVYHIR